MTEAPAPPEQTTPLTEEAIAAFKRQLEGQDSVAASVVQDCLLDLWGSLPDGDSRTEVERWLVETLERHLYAVTDVDARLESVIAVRTTDRSGRPGMALRATRDGAPGDPELLLLGDPGLPLRAPRDCQFHSR